MGPKFEVIDFAAAPAACAAYKLCSQLAGDCCPNGAGTTLDCCRGGLMQKETSAPKPAPKPTPKKEEKEEPKPSPAPKPKEKSSHAPKESDDKEKEKAPAPAAPSPKLEVVDFAVTPAACAAYKQCGHLAGNCCPNGKGSMLDCCRGGLTRRERRHQRHSAHEEKKKAPAPAPPTPKFEVIDFAAAPAACAAYKLC